MHSLAKVAVGLAGTGIVGLTYCAGYEVRAFRLRRVEIPVLPAGASPLRVLHLSDLHLTPSETKKQRWLRSLTQLRPDLVINTGDNLAHLEAVDPVLDALGGLLAVPGVFAFGSNDYWAPVLKNPARYLLPSGRHKKFHGGRLPWRDLRDGFRTAGWVDLTNAYGELTVNGLRLAFAGVDDPHLEYDRLQDVAGSADPSADVRIGVAHAPYLRVLDQFTRDGYDAIFAGHTHGGQLRVPFYGSLVTNCDLENERSRGLHQHRAGMHTAWMNVSAGLGTSPYAPYRFCCHPEATLATLTPR